MRQSLYIIDDFLNDPNELRSIALKQNYPRHEKPLGYPGRNSKHRQLINGFDQKVSEIVGKRLQPATDLYSHARFRLALDGEKGTESVHIDPSNWTVLLYLTLPEHCQDGTHLFRHKATNSDHAPFNEQQLKDMGFRDQNDFMSNLLAKDTNNPDAWEHLMTVPMRFNRLLIMQPQQYHDAGLSFGTGPENGRLIYVTTYY